MNPYFKGAGQVPINHDLIKSNTWWWTLPIMVCVLFFVLSATPGASADSTTPDADAATKERLWRVWWKRFADSCYEKDGSYYIVPEFDRRRPSSVDPDKVKSGTFVVKYTVYISGHYRERAARIPSPKDDLKVAAETLPAIAPGEYGRIHSVTVRKAKDGLMEVQGIEFIDQNQVSRDRYRERSDLTNRVTGERYWGRVINMDDAEDFMFANRNAAINRPFRKFYLRGFGNASSHSEQRDGPFNLVITQDKKGRLVGIPIEWLKRPLNEKQFIDMLKKRGSSKEELSTMVFEMVKQRKRRPEVEAAVLELLQSKK